MKTSQSELFQFDPAKLERAFLIKFGSCLILPEILEKNHQPFGLEEKMPEKLIDDVKNQLNSSPLIKEVEILHILPTKAFDLSELRIVTSNTSTSLQAIRFMPLIRCSLVIPVKNQEEASEMNYLYGEKAVDATTKFEIIYDGSIYAITRQVDIRKRIHPGAIDIRDIFLQAMQNEAVWKLKEIPPNPLREDYYVLFLVEDQDTRELIGRTARTGKGIYYVLPVPSNKDFAKVLGSILHNSSWCLLQYYDTVTKTDEVDEIARNIIELHSSIQSTINKISSLWYFNIYEHYKQSRILEKLISKHYALVLEYTNKVGRLRKEVADSRDLIEKQPMFKHSKEELIQELKPTKIDIEVFSRCAEYAREVTGKSYATKVTIVGVVVSILGAFLGSLILHYLGI
jgi:hypothetical protein